ncbi:MAG: beta-lactamase family protein [Gemmatimonadaceae bacterium]|nr:beta-lactamase family protein [Gemmatimonadaceae bacterium]
MMRSHARAVALALAPLAIVATAPSLRAQSAAPLIVPAKVDAVFKNFTRATPGCAVGIYQKGKVVYAKGYGMADLTFGVPITPITVFDIGSTSKQFAAASIIVLANEGKLSLTDDVRKYVPELPNYGKVITIDHMLRHTSGLRDYNGLLYLGGHHFEDYTTDDDALSIILAQRNTNFVPGTRWDYSNSGFFLLSVIVKRVTGQTLGDFAKARFFAPLGMNVTHFRTDHTALVPNRATAYEPADKGFTIDMSDWDQAGDGAVNTNVIELARWDANFYDAKVGGRALVDRLQEVGALDDGTSHGYGRGLFVDTYRGARRVHHGGSWAGYRAMLMRFPEQGVAIGLTCNRGDANTQRLAEQVADVVLDKSFREGKSFTPLRRAPGVAPAAANIDPTPYVGTFFSEEEQGALGVEAKDGAAVLSYSGRNIPLTRIADDEFIGMEGMIKVSFVDARQEARLSIAGRPATAYRRAERWQPSAAELAPLVGTYRSPELLSSWTIRQSGDSLFIKGRAVGESPLVPVIRDGYSSGSGFVRITRDANGAVSGFELSASRMKRIRFDR